MKDILLKEDKTYYDVGFTNDLEPFLSEDYNEDDLKYIEGFDTLEEAKACIRGLIFALEDLEYACILKTYVSYNDGNLETNDCFVVYEVYDKDTLIESRKEKVIN